MGKSAKSKNNGPKKDTSKSANQIKKERKEREKAKKEVGQGKYSKVLRKENFKEGSSGGAAGAHLRPDYVPMGKKKLRMMGGVVRTQGPKKIGEWTLKEHQKLPDRLLRETCQRLKRPNPRFPQAGKPRGGGGQQGDRGEQGAEGGKFRNGCVLPDPGGKKDKDILLYPNETYPTADYARQMAAMLGL